MREPGWHFILRDLIVPTGGSRESRYLSGLVDYDDDGAWGSARDGTSGGAHRGVCGVRPRGLTGLSLSARSSNRL
jgi:hypothetical protein